jgi:hypothetical protein
MDSSEISKAKSDEEKWQALTRHEKLGEVLLKLGKLNLTQLQALIDEHADSDQHLGELIVSKGLMSKQEILQALELQHQADKVSNDAVMELKDKHKES